MHILVIEDNRDIAENIHDYLEPRGHVLDFAADGITGLHLALINDYDAVVLDLGLPLLDGIELCRKLRGEGQRDIPVLVLTARDTLPDKLTGFEAGADDYLVKPFALQELEARLTVLTRRRSRQARVLRVGDLVFDQDSLTVERAGTAITLNPTGLKILRLLMDASPRVVGRAEIERVLWGDQVPDSDALRTHIYWLRTAIDKPFPTPLLHTVHGIGYQLSAEHG